MLDLKFEVYYKDEKTGEVEIVDSKLIKNECLLVKEENQPFLKYPFVNMGSLESILHFLSLRVFPYNRNERDNLLNSIGLNEYNIYEILKKTKGVDFDDFIWFKFDGDENLQFKDVHLRGRDKT